MKGQPKTGSLSEVGMFDKRVESSASSDSEYEDESEDKEMNSKGKVSPEKKEMEEKKGKKEKEKEESTRKVNDGRQSGNKVLWLVENLVEAIDKMEDEIRRKMRRVVETIGIESERIEKRHQVMENKLRGSEGLI